MLEDGREAILEMVERLLDSGHKKILLNLEEVPYIDSACLGELVRRHFAVDSKDGDLRLNVSKRYRLMFPNAVDDDGQMVFNFGRPEKNWAEELARSRPFPRRSKLVVAFVPVQRESRVRVQWTRTGTSEAEHQEYHQGDRTLRRSRPVVAIRGSRLEDSTSF